MNHKKMIFSIALAILILAQLGTCIYCITKEYQGHGFPRYLFWLKPGTYATYISDSPVEMELFIRYHMYKNHTVAVFTREYTGILYIHWKILGVQGENIDIFFNVTLFNITKASSLKILYDLKRLVGPMIYPEIPGDMYFTDIHGIPSPPKKITFTKNITVNYKNLEIYDQDNNLLGHFIWFLTPEIINYRKILVYRMIIDYLKWLGHGITVECYGSTCLDTNISKPTIYRSIIDHVSLVSPLKDYDEEITFNVMSVTLDSYRLLLLSCKNNLSVSDKYINDNKTLYTVICDPMIPKIYYDSSTGLLIAINLEFQNRTIYSSMEPRFTSPIFINDFFYNAFNITLIEMAGWSYRKPNGIVGMYIKLMDTNIPLKKPVFGKTFPSNKELNENLLLTFITTIALLLLSITIMYRGNRGKIKCVF